MIQTQPSFKLLPLVLESDYPYTGIAIGLSITVAFEDASASFADGDKL